MQSLSLFIAVVVQRAVMASAGKPLRVFIMAGQSNMEGHGYVDAKDQSGKPLNGTLSWLIKDPRTKDVFAPVLGKDGSWIVRNDVIVTTTDQNNRYGALTIGFGGEDSSIGPELGFGIQLADKLGERVLLLKTNWGGKSLAGDYRPPSAITKRGNPQNVSFAKLVDGSQVGVYFKLALDTIRDVLGRLSDIVPSYDASAGYELAAFEWHQGWNDGCDFHHPLSDMTNAAREYEQNLADFVVDMRKALGEFKTAPSLPFVIGASGFAGSPGHEAPNCDANFGGQVCQALRIIWGAQMAVGDAATHLEVGTVATVDSVPFGREKQYSPGDQGYHWWNNAETYFLLGKAMADATFELLPRPSFITV